MVTFLTAYSSFAPLGDLLGQQEVTPFFFFHETRDGSPYDQVEVAANLPWVVAVTPPDYGNVDPHPTNPINSEGVGLHNANFAQTAGVTGAGVNVGAISDGVSNLAAAQAANELPGVNVLGAGAGDEGTAMLEIIHDMAPGAALLFQTTGGGIVNHVNALNNLVANGANVIAEDIAFDAEPAFQQGLAAATAEAIAAAGVSVHSSAGNRGQNHSARVAAVGTGGGPDGSAGPFIGCGPFPPTNAVAIAPGGDTTFDVVLGASAGGTGSTFTLQWSEPRAIFPTAGAGGFTDLDLFVMDQALTTCLATSVAAQVFGTGDTIEQITMPAGLAGTAVKVVVSVFGNFGTVAAPVIDLRWRRTQAGGDPTTRAGSLNPDSNYVGLATSAAAVRATTSGIEGFSSGGPVQLGLTTTCPGGIFPCPGGGAAGPPVTATLGPTWAAADGVQVSGVGGFGNGTCPAINPGDCRFFGTSASAPHAAACDALTRDAAQAPASAVAPILAQLQGTATDFAPAGPDNVTGAGLLDCFQAIGVPEAICQDVEVPTDPGLCTAAVADVDNGSFDPFPAGNVFTLVQAPGGPYALNNTLVQLTATDQRGLTDACVATVTVVDLEAPVITCPAPQVLECTSPSGATATFNASATDNCGALTPGCDPASGSTFPIGVNALMCSAVDDSGNSDQCDSTITVVDTTPPTVACVESTNPSGKRVPRAKNEDGFFLVTTEDLCSTPTLTLGSFELASGETIKITQTRGKSGVRLVNTMGPAQIKHFQVGPGDAVITATDGSGNETSVSCLVPPPPK